LAHCLKAEEDNSSGRLLLSWFLHYNMKSITGPDPLNAEHCKSLEKLTDHIPIQR
jgi:hypothetical protein